MAQTIGTFDAVPAESTGRAGWIARFRRLSRSVGKQSWAGIFIAGIVNAFYDLGTRDEPRREPARASLLPVRQRQLLPQSHDAWAVPFHANALMYFPLATKISRRASFPLFGMGTWR